MKIKLKKKIESGIIFSSSRVKSEFFSFDEED